MPQGLVRLPEGGIRRCRSCGVWHPLLSFPETGEKGSRTLPYRHDCVACRRAYSRSHMANHREVCPEYTERVRVYGRQWRAEHATAPSWCAAERVRTAAYREDPAYVERERKANRRRYWEKPGFRDRQSAYSKAVRQTELGSLKARLACARYHARRRNAGGTLTVGDWRTILAKHQHRCAYCGATADSVGSRLEMDHMIPLSLGGAHDKTNIVPACRRCNASKHVGLGLVLCQPATPKGRNR